MHLGRHGSGQGGQHVAGKRKTCETVGGVVTEHDLDGWMLEAGIDDSMLDELLSFY